jgi:hypothetical protein
MLIRRRATHTCAPRQGHHQRRLVACRRTRCWPSGARSDRGLRTAPFGSPSSSAQSACREREGAGKIGRPYIIRHECSASEPPGPIGADIFVVVASQKETATGARFTCLLRDVPSPRRYARPRVDSAIVNQLDDGFVATHCMAEVGDNVVDTVQRAGEDIPSAVRSPAGCPRCFVVSTDGVGVSMNQGMYRQLVLSVQCRSPRVDGRCEAIVAGDVAGRRPHSTLARADTSDSDRPSGRRRLRDVGVVTQVLTAFTSHLDPGSARVMTTMLLRVKSSRHEC